MLCVFAGAAACATTGGMRSPTANANSVTIPYNPYDYDPDDLQRQAEAHCTTYGRRAVYVDETIDPSSVRWRYRHYNCV
jgi:hypothetical protein